LVEVLEINRVKIENYKAHFTPDFLPPLLEVDFLEFGFDSDELRGVLLEKEFALQLLVR
jgi:hypothetical protein